MRQPTRAEQKAIVEQWKRAAPELEAIRKRELRELTDDDARAAAHDLLALAPLVPLDDERVASSGLVRQQELFQRARRK